MIAVPLLAPHRIASRPAIDIMPMGGAETGLRPQRAERVLPPPNPPPATYADVSWLPPSAKQDARMHQPLPAGVLPGYDNAKPLFLGHYWMKGTPQLLAPKIACVDYSAGKGGPLMAYCWRGAEVLAPDAFRAAEPMPA